MVNLAQEGFAETTRTASRPFGLENWEDGRTIEQAIALFESREFERMLESGTKLFIESPEAGKWE
ncbi:hypothetical protein [Azonexus sp.]|uniref:hypothetical protein n=1 Tax=Azonexus sp. TaxID=1872668 RepID=UPI0039E3C106